MKLTVKNTKSMNKIYKTKLCYKTNLKHKKYYESS